MEILKISVSVLTISLKRASIYPWVCPHIHTHVHIHTHTHTCAHTHFYPLSPSDSPTISHNKATSAPFTYLHPPGEIASTVVFHQALSVHIPSSSPPLTRFHRTSQAPARLHFTILACLRLVSARRKWRKCCSGRPLSSDPKSTGHQFEWD